MLKIMRNGKSFKNLSILATSALFVGLLVGCGNSETSAPAQPEIKEVVKEVEVKKDVFAKETVEIVLDTKNFGYQPNEITVEKGVPFKLTVKNSDTILHDLQIDSEDFYEKVSMVQKDKPAIPGVHLHAEVGKQESKLFIASKEGTYEIYCMVPGHKENGMVATLTVTK